MADQVDRTRAAYQTNDPDGDQETSAYAIDFQNWQPDMQPRTYTGWAHPVDPRDVGLLSWFESGRTSEAVCHELMRVPTNTNIQSGDHGSHTAGRAGPTGRPGMSGLAHNQATEQSAVVIAPPTISPGIGFGTHQGPVPADPGHLTKAPSDRRVHQRNSPTYREELSYIRQPFGQGPWSESAGTMQRNDRADTTRPSTVHVPREPTAELYGQGSMPSYFGPGSLSQVNSMQGNCNQYDLAPGLIDLPSYGYAAGHSSMPMPAQRGVGYPPVFRVPTVDFQTYSNQASVFPEGYQVIDPHVQQDPVFPGGTQGVHPNHYHSQAFMGGSQVYPTNFFHTPAAPPPATVAKWQPFNPIPRAAERMHLRSVTNATPTKSGATYADLTRVRPSVGCQPPPTNINVGMIEICTFYPNAFQIPTVGMRAVHAGWTALDLAKAQLKPVGLHDSKGELDRARGRIQKQLKEGAEVCHGLPEKRAFNGHLVRAEHSAGFGSDMTAGS
ncbi:uncharacterized protein LTR77_000299 [Saxophila tyrrhenica]|uniref:Uncharacterized protein n=1 Tax=Saxophila tyrrhenica TaxID=1690608 RepID=A0AAV9PQF7_9PEZI|nr:hypothetical protein LTR77_000299 [Saxophila tyrrhenica]